MPATHDRHYSAAPSHRAQWFASEMRGRQTEGANLVISSLTFDDTFTFNDTWELIA
jgi:hypothetical protein